MKGFACHENEGLLVMYEMPASKKKARKQRACHVRRKGGSLRRLARYAIEYAKLAPPIYLIKVIPPTELLHNGCCVRTIIAIKKQNMIIDRYPGRKSSSSYRGRTFALALGPRDWAVFFFVYRAGRLRQAPLGSPIAG